jgi:hypothetical protein
MLLGEASLQIAGTFVTPKRLCSWCSRPTRSCACVLPVSALVELYFHKKQQEHKAERQMMQRRVHVALT